MTSGPHYITFEERLKKDKEIRQRMAELELKSLFTDEEDAEYKKLFRIYYIDNFDIRMYWKT